MKRPVTVGGMLVVAAAAQAGELDSALEAVLRDSAPEDTVSALVYLQRQVDVDGLSRGFQLQRSARTDRHRTTVLALRDAADDTQGDLVAHLGDLVAAGRIARFEPMWIVNAVRVDAPRAEIVALAGRPDVMRVYFNFPIEGIAPVPATARRQAVPVGGVEPGVVAVRAPEVWALGITGEGSLVATLDTGVEGSHPALASRWRGLDPAYAGNPEWAWFDPVTFTTFPQAFGSHGTHTMGTVCGGAPGAQVGVAPGAEWIHAAVIDRVSIPQTVSDAILAFQWMLDPDENPLTSFDVPHACSNSWGLADFHGYPDCDTEFWSFLDACEAAGIVMIFSAGNEGTSGLRRPADRATDDFRTFAVAAVDGNIPSWPLAGFSSQGPTFCTPGGGAAIKPDISAPGVNVISSVPGGGYGPNSGTSMASPHINGVVALMIQANPDLAVEQIKQIIFDTAFNLGSPGEDNQYGWGMVDAFDAVQEALSTASIAFSFPDGLPSFIDPNGGTTVPVVVSGQASTPEPGSGLLYYSTDGVNYTQVSMDEIQPNQYEAVFPGFSCGALVRYYFSAETTDAQTVYNPFSAPDVVYSDLAYTGINLVVSDDFEQDLGWTAEVVGATSGFWQRGVPVNDPNWSFDPESDGDGSGQAYLTQNAFGNTDVDNGAVRLTSPVLDLTSGNVTIAYQYFLNLAPASGGNDHLLVEISSSGEAGPWTVVADHTQNGGLSWHEEAVTQAELDALGVTLTADMRLRFTANDAEPQGVIEAGVDGVQITSLFCTGTGCPADLDGDGSVAVPDLLALLAAWGPNPGHPADLDGDGSVAVPDLLELLSAWGPC